MARPIVALTRCDFNRSDREVEEAVRSTVALAGGIPEKVARARKILIKPNYVGANSKPSDEEIRRHGGRLVSCAEPAVTRAVVALVRQANPTAGPKLLWSPSKYRRPGFEVLGPTGWIVVSAPLSWPG